jgi:hypothetical protein
MRSKPINAVVVVRLNETNRILWRNDKKRQSLYTRAPTAGVRQKNKRTNGRKAMYYTPVMLFDASKMCQERKKRMKLVSDTVVRRVVLSSVPRNGKNHFTPSTKGQKSPRQHTRSYDRHHVSINMPSFYEYLRERRNLHNRDVWIRTPSRFKLNPILQH